MCGKVSSNSNSCSSNYLEKFYKMFSDRNHVGRNEVKTACDSMRASGQKPPRPPKGDLRCGNALAGYSQSKEPWNPGKFKQNGPKV